MLAAGTASYAVIGKAIPAPRYKQANMPATVSNGAGGAAVLHAVSSVLALHSATCARKSRHTGKGRDIHPLP
jgi:hypothetical protein